MQYKRTLVTNLFTRIKMICFIRTIEDNIKFSFSTIHDNMKLQISILENMTLMEIRDKNDDVLNRPFSSYYHWELIKMTKMHKA